MAGKIDTIDEILTNENQSSDSEKDDDDNDILERLSGKKTKKKGRKCVWNEKIVDDLVDVILNNERYTRKLLLTNVKNVKNSEYYINVITEVKERCQERGETYPFDVKQTRQKFKRCVALCREAALKVKTKSGIKRFQEDKNFGSWFDKLFPYVTSMAGSQPEQAIEPSSSIRNDDHLEGESDDSNSISEASSAPSSSTPAVRKRKLFVPAHETSRNSKKATTERFLQELTNSVSEVKTMLENDTTKDLLQFLKEDSERQAKRDEMFLNMMANMFNFSNQNQSVCSTPSPRHYENQFPLSVRQDNFPSRSSTNVDQPNNGQNRYGMSSRTVFPRDINNTQSFTNFLNDYKDL